MDTLEISMELLSCAACCSAVVVAGVESSSVSVSVAVVAELPPGVSSLIVGIVDVAATGVVAVLFAVGPVRVR